jgi:hypothetical protein
VEIVAVEVLKPQPSRECPAQRGRPTTGCSEDVNALQSSHRSPQPAQVMAGPPQHWAERHQHLTVTSSGTSLNFVQRVKDKMLLYW